MADHEIEGKDYAIKPYGKFKAIFRERSSHPLKPGMSVDLLPFDDCLMQEDFPEIRRRIRTIDKAFDICEENISEDEDSDDTEKENALRVLGFLRGNASFFIREIDSFLEGKNAVAFSEFGKKYFDTIERISKTAEEESLKIGIPKEIIDGEICDFESRGFMRFLTYGMFL